MRKQAGRFSLHQMLKVSSMTLLSRMLGFIRELLLIRYFGGARALSDAFVTAFRIPNLIYELCVSGAFGPAIIPTLVYELKTNGQKSVSRLMTLLIGLLGTAMLSLSILIGYSANFVIAWVAPGFLTDQATVAAALLRILIGSLALNASIALITEALRTMHQFVISASGQVIINCIYIVGLIAYHYLNLSITTLALIMVMATASSLLVHLLAYRFYRFRFLRPDNHSWRAVHTISKRVLPVMVSVGIVHINSFIELQFASYLAIGSISLLTYSSNFTNLPLGIFSHACTTVIFPDFVRLASYAPRRLAFMFYETSKIMTWILAPLIASLIYFSYDIFNSLYGTAYFSPEQLITAQWLLITKASAIGFLAFNQILLIMFHALHETAVPGIVSLISLFCSIVLNFIVIQPYGIYGIAFTSSLVACLRTIILLLIAHTKLPVFKYATSYFSFLRRLILQLSCIGIPAISLVKVARLLLHRAGTTQALWFAQSLGLWLWVAVIWCIAAGIMYTTRSYFGIKLYLIDRTQR